MQDIKSVKLRILSCLCVYYTTNTGLKLYYFSLSRARTPDPVGRLLNICDDQIHDVGLERLRLILYPILPWNELQKLTTPSEMYHRLASLEQYSTEDKALNLFVFALKAIGGSSRGKYCAEKAKHIFRCDFTLGFSQQSKEIQFFFWLLKIDRRIPERFKKEIIEKCANILKLNHRQFRGSLPHLFVKLYQKKIVSENDTVQLRKVLLACKAHTQDEKVAVEKCVSYLVKIERDEEQEPFTTGLHKLMTF